MTNEYSTLGQTIQYPSSVTVKMKPEGYHVGPYGPAYIDPKGGSTWTGPTKGAASLKPMEVYGDGLEMIWTGGRMGAVKYASIKDRHLAKIEMINSAIYNDSSEAFVAIAKSFNVTVDNAKELWPLLKFAYDRITRPE